MTETQETWRAEPLLLRIHPDLTRLTGLGRTTLYAEVAAGRLRAVRIGRAVRVRRDDLEAWLDWHAHGGQDAYAKDADRPTGSVR